MCEKVMILSDSYNRGRREHNVYICNTCAITEVVKGRKLRNRIGRGW